MKTVELTGAALDWVVTTIVEPECTAADFLAFRDSVGGTYRCSTDWAQGGPIIERECIWLTHHTASKMHGAHKGDDVWFQKGPTPLIAAMRCYVASKLGDEVDVPTELTSYS
jgi:hypothetical protein